jgi:pantothenate synthetase
MAQALAPFPIEIDYLRLVDPLTFLPTDARDRELLVVGAVRVGRTRLIDNLRIPAPSRGATNPTE